MTTPTCNCDNVHLQREIAIECQCLGCHPYTTKTEPVLTCDCEGNCQDDDYYQTCPCMTTPCPDADEGCTDPNGWPIYHCTSTCACNIRGQCGEDDATESAENAESMNGA